MSTLATHGDFNSGDSGNPVSVEFGGITHAGLASSLPPAVVRRRANVQQGRALELVGHALEYLVDSRLFITSGLDERAEQEAIKMLMLASRAVFAECSEVVPLRRQLGLWIEKWLPWQA